MTPLYFTTRNRNKFPKLTELYEVLFDKSIKAQHNALFDTILTKVCYQKLMRYISGVNDNEYEI